MSERDEAGSSGPRWRPGGELAGAVRMLLDQLDHRYRSLERSLTVGLTDEDAARGLGERPSIAWHARHLAEAIGTVGEAALGTPPGPSELPTTDAAAWPALRASVVERATRTLGAFEAMDAGEWLEAPLLEVHPAFRDRMTTRLSFLQGHVYHLGYHLGAIGLLRAEWGANGAD